MHRTQQPRNLCLSDTSASSDGFFDSGFFLGESVEQLVARRGVDSQGGEVGVFLEQGPGLLDQCRGFGEEGLIFWAGVIDRKGPLGFDRSDPNPGQAACEKGVEGVLERLFCLFPGPAEF